MIEEISERMETGAAGAVVAGFYALLAQDNQKPENKGEREHKVTDEVSLTGSPDKTTQRGKLQELQLFTFNDPRNDLRDRNEEKQELPQHDEEKQAPQGKADEKHLDAGKTSSRSDLNQSLTGQAEARNQETTSEQSEAEQKDAAGQEQKQDKEAGMRRSNQNLNQARMQSDEAVHNLKQDHARESHVNRETSHRSHCEAKQLDDGVKVKGSRQEISHGAAGSMKVEGESKKTEGRARKDRSSDVKSGSTLTGAMNIEVPGFADEGAEIMESLIRRSLRADKAADDGDLFIKAAADIPYYLTEAA